MRVHDIRAASENRSYVRVFWTAWGVLLVIEKVIPSVPKKFASIVVVAGTFGSR
jgi:hypothetical protein